MNGLQIPWWALHALRGPSEPRGFAGKASAECKLRYRNPRTQPNAPKGSHRAKHQRGDQQWGGDAPMDRDGPVGPST